jgi:hypothetical protein
MDMIKRLPVSDLVARRGHLDRWIVVTGLGHSLFTVGAAALVVRAGGSVDRALTALATMFVLLFAGALAAGVVFGIRRRPGALRLDAVISLAAFEAGTWVFTDAHSIVGDLLSVLLEAIPVWAGAASGYSVAILIRGDKKESGAASTAEYNASQR